VRVVVRAVFSLPDIEIFSFALRMSVGAAVIVGGLKGRNFMIYDSSLNCGAAD
jgi:hypothetical protein